ncbi:MAG: hypothetical protein JO270_24875 [Acidobacteriaceae bacterium]|nr:hypothetical protein [Acidobacteriaceae bacterium]MBV8572015.1 hypothetical protein [Acidobacteriaceae bacterium]
MTNGEIRSQEWLDRIEELVRRVQALGDPNARAAAVDLLQAVLAFHAAGLERFIEIAAACDAPDKSTIERAAQDDLTSSMLLLHGLHPDDLHTRITRALEKLQEVFGSLGARLSLLAVEEAVVRLRFDSARPWAGAPVRTTIENAIFQAAPEISSVILEGLKEPAPPGFVPVSDLIGSRI